MSSYFDALARAVSEIVDGDDDAEFLRQLSTIEGKMYRDVYAITGDREFPDDLDRIYLLS